ncbi:tetratricopeptide repeat protein [Streptomyces sp. HNM0574]|uniref:tetratricopeptide repeat protein n=1 Tax=Streptomyces sp. HNM0574 TaxID=2714954 RepID=UPI00146E189B|nr:tetratricopeptide repeat protein [Streptomyces sp. HNM0574]
MRNEDRPVESHTNSVADGHYYGPVVQARNVQINHYDRDRDEDERDPVLPAVRREPGSCLADLVVDGDPPRLMTPSGTLYVVTLQARTRRAVVLHGARAVVVSRRSPRPACLTPRLGRAIVPRYFRTDLDADPPRLHAEGTDFPFQISETDVEQFRFEVVTSRDEVAWRLELDWACGIHEGTLVLDDNGAPFEAYPVPALFDGRSPSALSSGCGFGGHQPGCPALRVEKPAPERHPAPPVTGGDGGREELLRTVLELDAALRPADPDQPESWPGYARLSGPVRMLLGRADFPGDAPEPFRALLLRFVRHLFVTGQQRLGVTLARPALRRWTETLGEDHPHTLALTNRLAGCLLADGAAGQARELWEDLVPRTARVLGEDHPDTLTAGGNLAACLMELGAYEQAREAHTETLRRSTRALGPDHPATLRTAGNLALGMRMLGDHEAARALGEDTLRRYRATLGDDHPDTLAEAGSLASSLAQLGEREAARMLREDTLRRRRRVLGEDHPDTRRSRAGGDGRP